MRRLTQENALQKVKKSLGDGYSFDKFEYVSYNKPVTVTCKKHGDFTIGIWRWYKRFRFVYCQR